ncbi:MAG: 50S ribosomal protein L11 methyltransferase [Lachnospiraceae bacterium]
MKWKKFTLETTTEAVDLVSAMLSELGIDGIEIQDNQPLSEEDKKKMFIDILPELPADDGKALISFYLEEGTDMEEMLTAVRNGLTELDNFIYTGEKNITVSETEDADWINNWKEFFKPFRVDDTIVIKPTWETLEDKRDGDMVIEIDPGTAFGTGSHETTKLCMLNLKKYMQGGERVLDLGCGSGILSIAARKLGASYVLGTDIDENAVLVSGENTEQNHIKTAAISQAPGINPEADMDVFAAAGSGCGFFCCNVLSEERTRTLIGDSYDIVVANILADVIIPLSAIAGAFLKPCGLFISSGIINTKADDVKKALLANDFEIAEQTQMGDWVSFVARKKNMR